MSAIPPAYRDPIARYGPLADREAHKYGLSGAELVAKIISGESGFRMAAVSSAGARGPGQFMPGTRAAFIKRYGVDPWKSPADAVHGTALFMRDQGLKGYNPGGGQGYINYILGQKVGGVPAGQPGTAGATTAAPVADAGPVIGTEQRSTLVRVLLSALFVLAGAALAVTGAVRAVGLRAKPAAAGAAA